MISERMEKLVRRYGGLCQQEAVSRKGADIQSTNETQTELLDAISDLEAKYETVVSLAAENAYPCVTDCSALTMDFSYNNCTCPEEQVKECKLEWVRLEADALIAKGKEE